MKKIRLFFSIILILSIVTYTTVNFTSDKAQAAGNIYTNDTSFTLEVGHYKTIHIHGTSSRTYWHSSNSHVASVTSGGKVTAVAPGSATITASVAGKKLISKVTVLKINKKTLTLQAGKTDTLKITGPYTHVTWSTSNASVATVSSKGVVTAKAPGTADITATVNGKNITSKVSVIKINNNSIVLELGGETGFVKTLHVDGTSSHITWTSNNNSVATVSSSGLVTAKGAGTATITASVAGYKLTCKVEVVKVNYKEFTLKMGQTKKLKISGSTSTVTWASNKHSVALVSSNGTVSTVSKGKALIFGYVDGRRVISTVHVVD